MKRLYAVLWMMSLVALALPAAAQSERVVVGSKAFPESWILAEAVTMLAQSTGARAEHAQNLGGTEITYGALASGSIDVYPEYTGTLREVVLRGAAGAALDITDMRTELARRGIGLGDPLGFDDSYALATTARRADGDGLRSISDLRRAANVRVGLTHEFLGRADGYPGLAARYGLALSDVRGIQHEMALEALGHGDLDVVDVYTTDAQIERLGLRVLADDRHFFPRYDAVLVYRSDLATRAPRAFEAMMRLAGRVDEATMRRANARLVLDGRSVHDAASGLLHDALGNDVATLASPSVALEIARNTLRHLELVAAALLASIGIGVPLGILAARSRVLAIVTTSVTGLLQTVPSLALLALLVPLLGIGAKPALTALVLYGLLPIVRGTHVGLVTIPAAITESAEALGLPPRARLWRVLLPMASPHVLAGVRTSAVIAVGTATLAALIGAEGLGGPILQGIALRNTALVLQGAVPAALLALAVDAAFALSAWVIVPAGLRVRASEPR
jgi:osmoprotectant transport system permease protein